MPKLKGKYTRTQENDLWRHKPRRQLFVRLGIEYFVYCALTAACFASCKGYRSLEGSGKPVYFIGSNEIFGDTLYPEQTVSYSQILGLKGNTTESVELFPRNESKVLINGPTLFRKQNDVALVYPHEHIMIQGDYDDYSFSTVGSNLQRERELQVFKTFRKIEQYPAVPRMPEYTIQTVLMLEQQQKDKIVKAEARSQQVFDSLLNVSDVSDQFRKLTSNYIKGRYDASLMSVYNLYSDTLKAYGLYREKLRQLLPYFNNVSNQSEFNSNVRFLLNEVHSWLFQGNALWSLPDETEFRKCFDTIQNNFRGLSRDYLLSRLMWRAYSKGLDVPASYARMYKRYSVNRSYRKIVNRTKRERRRDVRNEKGINNLLLTADGRTETNLEEIFNKHKGKIVLVDLWASWCLPCIRELPRLKQLENKYGADKIVFIGVSLDKQTESWHRAMRIAGVDTASNFLLLNAAKTSFYKRYKVNTIPRYLLFGTNGEIINDNAPSPDDPVLPLLLDQYLSKQ